MAGDAPTLHLGEAGGRLLAAAFTFLGEMLPQREPTEATTRLTNEVKARFDECLERDEQERPRLTVTLPDEAALAKARTFAGGVA